MQLQQMNCIPLLKNTKFLLIHKEKSYGWTKLTYFPRRCPWFIIIILGSEPDILTIIFLIKVAKTILLNMFTELNPN